MTDTEQCSSESLPWDDSLRHERVTTEVYGEYLDTLPEADDYLLLGFSPSSRTIKQRWRNNRLSAHFIADYLSTFFPERHEDANSQRYKQGKGAVSYVTNELLENAMKYSIDGQDCPVKFGIHLLETPEQVTVVTYVVNPISNENKKRLCTFIEQLQTHAPSDLYIQQLEQSAAQNSQVSGLGLITMITDYDVRLGWKFEALPSNPTLSTVTTMAQLTV